ncbi:MAG TPA: Gfo/Idh/MocA family oxidoreductase [Anaerolineae bacterium]|nr:Gfo/Idh/MocA family oxidoreductase [Anaerolineae bacterium]
MNIIRWGLLSTANINKRLIPAIRRSKRGELIAVASRDEQKAKDYAREWEIPISFGSYEEMLTSGSIDAVYISLPNHLHAEWSVRALSEGLHVLCEKPFALSVDEVDQMVTASKTHQRVLAEAFMYRHHPQTLLAGEWVQSGKLGEISLVRGVFNFTLQEQHRIRLVPEFGGGSLWDIGVYPLSFAQFIMGSHPTRVSGAQWIGETGVDETFAGLLHYTNDRFATIGSSFRSPFYTSAEIIGTEGRLVFNRPFVVLDETRKMIFHPQDGGPREIPVPEKELYLGQIEDMHAAILDGKPSYVSLEETRDHIRTVEALYKSAQDVQIVHLD